ncbi:helix-turn-helix transcriptional regulator [Salmonella enterica]|nr:helix-turn-helix transcriptional regulator [Salmonella enterica]
MEKADKTQIDKIRIIENYSIIRFGERLKEAMGDMTYRELGRRSGLSETTIRKYIQGKIYPGIDSAALVAHACNVSMMWLLTGQSNNADNCLSVSATPSNSSTQPTDQLAIMLQRIDEQDKDALVDALCNIGIKGILSKLQQSGTQHGHPEREYTTQELESMIMTLPVRESLKTAFARGITAGEDADKEILRILESHQQGVSPEGSGNKTTTPAPSLKQKAG